MAITELTLRRAAELRDMVDDYVDASTRALTARWAQAWQEIANEWQDTITVILARKAAGDQLTPAQITQLARTQRALAMTSSRLRELAAEIGPLLEPAVREVVERTADLTTGVAMSQMPPVDQRLLPSFTRVDKSALEQIIERSLGQIHASSLPLADDAVDALKSSLIRAVPSGWHPDKAAREMLRRTRGAFNGGLTRALTLARSELLDAHRYANTAQNAANPAVIAQVWTATLGPRTCPSCLAHHGEEYPPDAFGPLDHPAGRCTFTPKTKSWADLGFPNIEEPPDLIQQPMDWINENPHDAVRALGPDRYRMLMDGEIGLKDMTQKRTTPEWRDSYTATSVRDLKARVRGGG
ncbi:phage minor head protein [Brevibacterium casei]|uniref:Phage head morphogenesis domain-containing protein n=1 Tax=Brevibacterium casei TaxID=33889 RepID=A0AB34XRD3_9MICO|nr:phage minor head protein [Brevibacterium casei]KZE19158.1 hypothetical protein AVW13_11925 [Brevibacterium casei]